MGEVMGWEIKLLPIFQREKNSEGSQTMGFLLLPN